MDPPTTSQAQPEQLQQAEQRVQGGRITGIDMARGLAMAGMVVVHFVNFRQDEGAALATLAELFRGRAMPLFMLLGGIGVTFLVRRSTTPERDLVLRAAMLFGLGLFLTEHIDRLAIVLQSYGLFFVLAAILYRLPSSVLLLLVPVITAVGAVTFQTVGNPRAQTTFDEALSYNGLESLVFDGFYPLFPVGAFFVLGIWLGRIDLRSDRVAATLAGVGAAVGLAVPLLGNRIISSLDLQGAIDSRSADGMFHLARLLDSTGHSAMPAWVLSAAGTSAAVLGFSLLIAPRVAAMVHPITVVGSMSLTFYVYQAWITRLVPPTRETSIGVEWLFTIAVYVSFAVLALMWRHWFRSGPLERLLRVGSGPRKGGNA